MKRIDLAAGRAASLDNGIVTGVSALDNGTGSGVAALDNGIGSGLNNKSSRVVLIGAAETKLAADSGRILAHPTTFGYLISSSSFTIVVF